MQGLTVKFGGLTAINGLSMQVERGRIHALIGPNGAGKSTTFNCISRYYRPTSGRISFDGADITRKKPHEMAALGVARTFQNLELFGALSVRENALLHLRARRGHGRALLRPAGAEARERVEHLLERVGLADFLDTPACSLDFGRQKMLELARALAISLLLLDEPAAGLRNREIETLDRLLTELCERDGITVLLVEHVMQLVMSISDRITVMSFGEKIAEGTPAEVRSNPASSKPIWAREPPVADYLLEVEAVSAAYGNIRALQDVSLKVPQGAIVALLGANGAGKSTTLNVISRLVAPTAGGVRFAGEAIHRLPADAIVGRGIVQVPEGREIFRDMSVRENLEMGAYLRRDRGAIRRPGHRLRHLPRLRERLEQKAATLSGGEQQMLATGRAMMARPA